MEGGGKRYIVTREPIGTANKHFQDLSTQLSGIESTLQIMHNIIQSLSQKSSSFEIQLQNIVENSTKTSEYFSDINNKFQTLNVKMDKRGRRLKKQKKKQLGVEKYAQTEYNLFIKPVESLQQPIQSSKATSTDKLKIKEENSENPPKLNEKINENINSDEIASNDDELVDNPEDIPAVLVNTRSSKESNSSITDCSLLVTLNKETDFPDGCWLGDPQDSNRRVRVALSPNELVLLTQNFTTPEKLALALLDKLFTRETLAVSNLTGKGRHNKKRLDPLLIYGIYSQLRYLHNITDSDWSRIKNNMEAKCRFLWRRKMRSKYPELHQQQKSSNSNQSDQLTGKQVQQHQPIMGWGNEVLIAGRGSEETGNIILYPLYQVDTSQLVQVAGLQNGEIVREKCGELASTEASLAQSDQSVPTDIDSMDTRQEQVVNVELGGRASSSKQSIQQKPIEQNQTEINHQTLTLSGGDLIINDLGEVISITSEAADVDCMMTVSSVDYL